jgi:hypothetical protein
MHDWILDAARALVVTGNELHRARSRLLVAGRIALDSAGATENPGKIATGVLHDNTAEPQFEPQLGRLALTLRLLLRFGLGACLLELVGLLSP